MNTLSLFLYLVGISGSLSTLLAIVSVGLVLLSILFVGIGASMREFKHRDSEEWKEGKALQNKSVLTLSAAILIGFFAVLIPPKETFYMIAASEIGGQIAQLEEVQEFGGEIGGLATDTIVLLRNQIQQINETIEPEINKTIEPESNSNDDE